MSYCPNCSTLLQDPPPMECPKCAASFEEGSAWRPTATPERALALAQAQEERERATAKWAPVKIFLSLLFGALALIAAWQGPGPADDRTSSLIVILVLTGVALMMRRAPWWAWLLLLPVLLMGGCTAFFMCCFVWRGG